MDDFFQDMINETFDTSPKKDVPSAEKIYHTGSEIEAEPVCQKNINPFTKTLEDVLKTQLQPHLPEPIQLSALPEECLSYANLKKLAPGRSYFSLFAVDKPDNIWVLHLERSVGEGLAYWVSQNKYAQKHAEIFKKLREADSMVFLEIGQIQKKIFEALLSSWPMVQNTKIVRTRHLLQLNHIHGVDPNEECVIQPFFLQNSVFKGKIHLVFPRQYILFP